MKNRGIGLANGGGPVPSPYRRALQAGRASRGGDDGYEIDDMAYQYRWPAYAAPGADTWTNEPTGAPGEQLTEGPFFDATGESPDGTDPIFDNWTRGREEAGFKGPQSNGYVSPYVDRAGVVDRRTVNVSPAFERAVEAVQGLSYDEFRELFRLSPYVNRTPSLGAGGRGVRRGQSDRGGDLEK